MEPLINADKITTKLDPRPTNHDPPFLSHRDHRDHREHRESQNLTATHAKRNKNRPTTAGIEAVDSSVIPPVHAAYPEILRISADVSG